MGSCKMAVVLRCLQKKQSGQGVNALGVPELPITVLQNSVEYLIDIKCLNDGSDYEYL